MFNGSMFMGESSNLWQFNMFRRMLSSNYIMAIMQKLCSFSCKISRYVPCSAHFPWCVWKWKTSDTNLLGGLCLGSVSIIDVIAATSMEVQQQILSLMFVGQSVTI